MQDLGVANIEKLKGYTENLMTKLASHKSALNEYSGQLIKLRRLSAAGHLLVSSERLPSSVKLAEATVELEASLPGMTVQSWCL